MALKKWFTKAKKRECTWSQISCDDPVIAQRIIELFEERGVNASDLEEILEAVGIHMPIRIREGIFPSFYVECVMEEGSSCQILVLPKTKLAIDIWTVQGNENRKYYVTAVGETSYLKKWQAFLEQKTIICDDRQKNFKFGEKEFSYEVDFGGNPPKKLKISFDTGKEENNWTPEYMEKIENYLSGISEDQKVYQIYQNLMGLQGVSPNPLASYEKSRIVWHQNGSICSEIIIHKGIVQSYTVTDITEEGERIYQVFADGSWSYRDSVTAIRYKKVINQKDKKYHTTFEMIGRENIDKANPKEMVESAEKRVRELMNEASMM